MRLLGFLKRDWRWLAACSAILLIACFVRFYDLDLKPVHQDEGVNGYFLTRLHNRGDYRYDPANYHGPTLYYAAAVSSYCFGLTTTAIRLVPALFGVGTVLLAFFLRRRIGIVGSLTTALLVSLSPGAVYMSRYFIHESLFVFTGLAAIVATLRYYDSGSPVYAILAFAAFGSMCATKETFIISAGVVAIAVVVTPLYMRLRKRPGIEPHELTNEIRKPTVERLGGRFRVALSLLGGVGAFVIVVALFFSSFFSNPEWSRDLFRALPLWTVAGTVDHPHEFYMYVWWLLQEEGPILALGLVGAGLALWRATGRFAIFATLWAGGLITAYSLIPYKTPWLTLNFIIPLAILSGYAVNALDKRIRKPSHRALLITSLVIGVVTSAYQMAVLNYIRYDDDRYPYVYAHTHRDVNRLMHDVAQLTNGAGTAQETSIAVTAPEYWPLPWYLRDHKHVGYYARVTTVGERIVLCSEAQEPEIQATLGQAYQRVDSYILRPGLRLVLYTMRSSPEHGNSNVGGF
jgi:uncharacterized protein (TIGR03663 family)